MNFSGKRVAICQPSIILGGRLSVIIGIARALNDFDIVPDILTTKVSFARSDIEKMYGKNVRINIRVDPTLLPLWGDWRILAFNARLKRIARSYDILINTSNSLAMLPSKSQVLSYVFYPRKSRIDSAFQDIHFPEVPLRVLSVKGLSRLMLRRVYKEVRPVPEHAIVTMTGFTKKALCRAYKDLSVNLPIVYPAVPLSDFWCENLSRENMVVTTGRFAKDKRQLSQIGIAQHLPDFDFHIFGFSGSSNYFQKCRDYIKVNQIDNVCLHPDASFSEMVECLQRAKYFLHTLINEPFGLTAVQAMAAGCIPVVHDSGGQVEAVPVSNLRYSKFEQVPGIFHHLDSLARKDIDMIRSQLQSHVRSQYGEPIFDSKIKSELIKVLA